MENKAEAGSHSPDLPGSSRDPSAAKHGVPWEPSQRLWSQTTCVFGLACSGRSVIISMRPKAPREMGILCLLEPRARNLRAQRSLDDCPFHPPMAHHVASGLHTSVGRECSAWSLSSHSSHPIPSRSSLTLWKVSIQFDKIQQTCSECVPRARHCVKHWGCGSELPRYLPLSVPNATLLLLPPFYSCAHIWKQGSCPQVLVFFAADLTSCVLCFSHVPLCLYPPEICI